MKIVAVSPIVAMHKRDWLAFSRRNFNDSTIISSAFESWFCDYGKCEESSKIAMQEVEAELITGRTHQIRGQIKALGNSFHVAGDNLYSGVTSTTVSTTELKSTHSPSSAYLALQATSIEFPLVYASPFLNHNYINLHHQRLMMLLYILRHKLPICNDKSEKKLYSNSLSGTSICFTIQKVWWDPLSAYLNSKPSPNNKFI